jgi:hypothetical protein
MAHSWLRRWHALNSRERRVLLTAWLLMPCFAIGLRVFGLHRWRAALPLGAAGRLPMDGLPTPAIARLVNLAARRSPLHASCLTRSVLLEYMLARRRIPADLKIGVRLAGGRLDAHAWVETGGVPINDEPDIAERYPPLIAQGTIGHARFP